MFFFCVGILGSFKIVREEKKASNNKESLRGVQRRLVKSLRSREEDEKVLSLLL